MSNYYSAENDVDGDDTVSCANGNLEDNHRKMLRRAANRRSAQLSRARKKAHLEELKIENSRLQRLVDIMDSQPELVFCISGIGDITYVSERTEIFININLSGDGSDEVPTHINQILSKESVKDVLGAIEMLSQHIDTESTLFSSKEVFFHDAFGHPLVGSLRCSKVVKRTTLQELQSSEDITFDSSEITNNIQSSNTKTNYSAKKQRTSKDNKSPTNLYNNIVTSNSGVIDDSGIKTEAGDWSTLKLLTDCVSSMLPNSSSNSDLSGLAPKYLYNSKSINSRVTNTNRSDKTFQNMTPTSSWVGASGEIIHTIDNTMPTQIASTVNSSASNVTTTKSKRRDDIEYVCVIRTSDNCFVPHGVLNGQTTKNCDPRLLLFSSQLSTASMVAHDREQNSNSDTTSDKRSREGEGDGTTVSADSEENTSETYNSSGAQPNSESSKQRNSTSSETCSEDNCSNNIESSETNST